jgi:cytochrome b subunit of formate dehydrogenase/copper chaperone CopZ
MERVIADKGVILRHSLIEIAEHWLLALSGLVLIFSGFGELPVYKRFMLTSVPGFEWSGDFFLNLKIHYIAAIVFVSVMIFHAIYHGWLGHRGLLPKRGDMKASLLTISGMFGFGEEPKSAKYLPEQRLAYAFLGAVGLVLVLTGIAKVVKNLPGVYLPPALVTAMTLTHTVVTIFFLFGVLAHLAALIFKVNRPLVRSVFTGKVHLDYVRERHTVWYDRLIQEKAIDPERKTKDEDPPAASGQPEEGINNGTDLLTEKEKMSMVSVVKVKGMRCNHCVQSVTRALNILEGLQNVEVDLIQGKVRFDNPGHLPPEKVKETIEKAGYEVVS